MSFIKAQRQQAKIRLSVASPTGFGKTISALMIAYGITNDWSKIGVIDTENKSASLYANHKLPNGFTIGEFMVSHIEPPYTPEKYSQAIKEGEDAGFEVLIIDSVTHVWQGQGGLLEYNDSLGGNKFQNWAKTTPRYQKWLDSILHSKCHIITTNRKKQAYALINEGGKSKVEKQGMEDQIRDGYDYEMTLAFEIINDAHLAKASKDRTSLFMNKPEFIITPETGKLIKQWCETGIEAVKEQPKSNGLPTNNQAADFYEVWQKEVKAISKQSNLLELYNHHKSTIMEDEKLKDMFKVRQSELTPKATVK